MGRSACFIWILLGTLTVLGQEITAPPGDRITFVRLHVKSGQVEIVSATSVPGTLKGRRKAPEPSAFFSMALETSDGVATWADGFDDPCIRRVEVQDPDRPGTWQVKVVQSDEADLTVRVPFQKEARQLSIYRNAPPTTPLGPVDGPSTTGTPKTAPILVARIQLPPE